MKRNDTELDYLQAFMTVNKTVKQRMTVYKTVKQRMTVNKTVKQRMKHFALGMKHCDHVTPSFQEVTENMLSSTLQEMAHSPKWKQWPI